MTGSIGKNAGEIITLQDENYQSWRHIIEKASHDLIGTFSIIRQQNVFLMGVLPILLKGYHLAVDNHLMDMEIKEKQLNIMADMDSEPHIAAAIDSLYRLNTYCEQLAADSRDSQLLSVKDCINDVLNKYSFNNDEQRNLVHVDIDQDFQIKCVPIFLESLLRNCLDNGLRSIEKAGKGTITIWISHETNGDVLNFKDTGLGMSEDMRLRVFDRFLSKRGENTIPGLGFCRTAVRYAGGDVFCDAVDGEYTHFVIRFSGVL